VSLYDWERNDRLRGEGHQAIARMGDGLDSIDELREADSEGAEELIEAIASGAPHYHLAVNTVNVGQIGNLPHGAIVETPGIVDGNGVHGVAVGSLPDGIAELLRREIAVARLSVDAAVTGDRRLALQCLLLDPVITDLDIGKQILDDYLETYRAYLPQFWA
jgi:alpha-galactosidase/6-phospho-beta-glucosidase family protein